MSLNKVYAVYGFVNRHWGLVRTFQKKNDASSFMKSLKSYQKAKRAGLPSTLGSKFLDDYAVFYESFLLQEIEVV